MQIMLLALSHYIALKLIIVHSFHLFYELILIITLSFLSWHLDVLCETFAALINCTKATKYNDSPYLRIDFRMLYHIMRFYEETIGTK